MSPKPRLPGVDEKALEALARQFPSHSVGAGAPPTTPETKAPLAGDPAKTPSLAGEPAKTPEPAPDLPTAPGATGGPVKTTGAAVEAAKTPHATMGAPTRPLASTGDPVKTPRTADPEWTPKVTGGRTPTPSGRGGPPKAPNAVGEPPKALGAASPPSPPPAPATVIRSSGSGRLLAPVALLAALVALVVAGAGVAPPAAIQWVKDKVGSPTVVGLLTERRDAVEARFAEGSTAIGGLEAQLKAAVTRLEAIEAVGGSSQAAAKRIDALEAAVNGLTARLAANDETAKALLARLNDMQGRIGEFETAAKATGDAQQRALGELAASVKNDRRPERLYLASMQLRSTTQTSGRFAKELAAVSPLAGNGEETRAALRVLASRAETGVPTVSELRATFARNVSPRLAAYAPVARGSAAERGTAWVRSFFASGQPRSAPSGNRNATAIALAERHLADGQLAAAVDQLLLLEDNAALIVTEWLREASARLAIDRASTTLVAQAFEQVISTP